MVGKPLFLGTLWYFDHLSLFLKPIVPPVEIFDVFFNGEVSAGFIETCPTNPAFWNPSRFPGFNVGVPGLGRTTMEEK